MPDPSPASFDGLFRRTSRRVRIRRALRTVFTGLAFGIACGAVTAFAFWAFGTAVHVPVVATGLGVLGAMVGAFAAGRARWSDTDVALFLDARLGAREAITSAVALAPEATERATVLRSRASAALAVADLKAVLPRVFAPVHGISLLGIGLIGAFSLVPSPFAKPPDSRAKGTELVRKAAVAGLERIEALEKAEGLSDADAERLKKLARDAKQLGGDLARGIPKREALARVGRLRDDIARERERFSDHRERPGLEAAVNALAAEEQTRRAAKALEEGDVVGFDEEMQRLANQAEADARAKARDALERAREAAKSKNARRLAEMLERQRKLWKEREEAARALRELAQLLGEQLDEQQRDALRGFEQGDPQAAERLAEALADVLSELDEEERKRLVAELARRLSGSEAGPVDPERFAELGKRSSSADARRAMREALRELARNPSPDADRERALGEAERGGAEAERGLVPIPLPTPGQGPGTGPSAPGTPPRSPGGQPGPGGGSEKHAPAPNVSNPSAAEEFRSKAEAKLLPGAPLGTRALGRAPSRAGETADQVGTGKLGSVASQEVSAVENSDVPEEYREHVGRYFQP